MSLKYNIGEEAAKESEGQGEAQEDVQGFVPRAGLGTQSPEPPLQRKWPVLQENRLSLVGIERRGLCQRQVFWVHVAWSLKKQGKAGSSWSGAVAVFENKQTNNDRSACW